VRSVGGQGEGGVGYEIVERSRVETVSRQLVQGSLAIGTIVAGALVLLWLCYANPKTVDFLIATEGEMKKVNWSSRREVFGSTWVVIGVSVLIATVLFGADFVFSTFFSEIGVLQN
jgi:preprotein translocase SecE subunit